jgi:hypothetical protein
MLRIIACCTIATLLLACPVNSSASILYSIDINNDIVATIDTETGIVGSLNPAVLWPFARAALAYHGSLLYEINTPAACGQEEHGRLNLIDPNGPTVIAGFQVLTLNGTWVNRFRIGDITSDGTHVYMTHIPIGCGPTYSQLATLSSAAEMTVVADFSGVGADMNELAASGTGQLYALDERSAAGQADLYLVTPPATYQLVGTHSMTPGAVLLGMTFEATGALWVLERGPVDPNGLLRQIDPATGQAVQSVPVSSAFGLNGLAAPDLATPTILGTWGRLKTMYR